MVAILQRYGVRFVVIGGFAIQLHQVDGLPESRAPAAARVAVVMGHHARSPGLSGIGPCGGRPRQGILEFWGSLIAGRRDQNGRSSRDRRSYEWRDQARL